LYDVTSSRRYYLAAGHARRYSQVAFGCSRPPRVHDSRHITQTMHLGRQGAHTRDLFISCGLQIGSPCSWSWISGCCHRIHVPTILLAYLPRYLFHPRHPPTTCISVEGRAFLVVVTFCCRTCRRLCFCLARYCPYLFCHIRHTVDGSLHGWRIRSRDGHEYVNKRVLDGRRGAGRQAQNANAKALNLRY